MPITSIQETPLNQTQIESMRFALEALEGLINRTSAQAIYSFMETERRIAISACVGLREALAEQPAQLRQDPLAMKTHGAWDGLELLDDLPDGACLYTSPPAQRKPLTGLMSIARTHPHGQVVTVSFETADEAIAFEHYAIKAAHDIKEQP
jgi:hypothetical protein